VGLKLLVGSSRIIIKVGALRRHKIDDSGEFTEALYFQYKLIFLV
jgi:hypothetical protein